MNKAVMLSIRPKWVEKIANGEKTIDVRKTRPKLQTPFKCYIYCTQPKYPHEDFILTDYPKPQFYGGGKVIGEFTCTNLDWITRVGFSGRLMPSRYSICSHNNMDVLPIDDLLHAARLSYAELANYLDGGNGYGWHISGLRIYDQPRELTEFRRACSNSWYCESCAMYWENNGTCGNASLYIKHPPQSWCYVEAMKDD